MFPNIFLEKGPRQPVLKKKKVIDVVTDKEISFLNLFHTELKS